jgi:hypothetical protein
MISRAENIALGLYALGIKKGDRARCLPPIRPNGL